MYTPVLFLIWRDDGYAPAMRDAVRRLDGLERALAFTRAPFDPNSRFARDGVGPALTVELAFADEAALAAGAGALAPSLAGRFEAQAMRGRWFATPDPVFRLVDGGRPCTLLVEYTGEAEEPIVWLDHYDAHHPAIMTRFPDVRDVATYRPAADLPLPAVWTRAAAMQRNKVVFDSTAALRAALAAPIMREMRADFEAFPPYTGGATHHATETTDLRA